jgi:formate dehydrogenase
VTTKAGSVVAVVEISDTLQAGHASLPNGGGLDYPDAAGRAVVHGVAPNELTSAGDRDWIAGTPWHKHVAARIEAAD